MDFIINQIEPFQRQFTTDNDEGSPDFHPARITPLTRAQVARTPRRIWKFCIRRELVTDLIIDFDHLSIEVQSKRNIHGLSKDQIPKSTRNTGLAIARRSIHENGGPRIEGGAQTLE